MENRIIVSRHKAAIEFIAQSLWGAGNFCMTKRADTITGIVRIDRSPEFSEGMDTDEIIPVFASATPDDVRGRDVFGNLPLSLAALARTVTAIEFEKDTPRGQEYTLADMERCGAKLEKYEVLRAGFLLGDTQGYKQRDK